MSSQHHIEDRLIAEPWWHKPGPDVFTCLTPSIASSLELTRRCEPGHRSPQLCTGPRGFHTAAASLGAQCYLDCNSTDACIIFTSDVFTRLKGLSQCRWPLVKVTEPFHERLVVIGLYLRSTSLADAMYREYDCAALGAAHLSSYTTSWHSPHH